MNKLVLALLFVSFFTASYSQQSDHQMKMAPAEKPATLMPGLGTLHHPVSTTNAEAQKYFDQGLALCYGFNHDEALRSFKRAAELDPQMVMADWGIALALGPNINLDVDPARERAAYDAVQKALALARGAPAHERAYVEALARRYANARAGGPRIDLKALAADY